MTQFHKDMKTYALQAAENGYKPTVTPACANFVSAIARKSGLDININYVPDFFKIGKKCDPKAGVLVIFDKTYDAVNPYGIGKEDTMTHVAIMVSKTKFVHYSNSYKSPKILTIQDAKNLGWGINCYLDIDSAENEIKNHWAYDSYCNLVKHKIVKTKEEDEDLNGIATRGEVMKMISRLVNYIENNFKEEK